MPIFSAGPTILFFFVIKAFFFFKSVLLYSFLRIPQLPLSFTTNIIYCRDP